jgi:transcriptional antiterminator RfaH
MGGSLAYLFADQSQFFTSDARKTSAQHAAVYLQSFERGASMNNQSVWDDLCWYLVQTHSRQEDRAESNLRSFGIETLAPKYKDRRRNFYTGEVTLYARPLFPSYIFARFIAKELHKKVRNTRGIRRLVSFGDSPTVVDEEIIAMIQSRIGDDGFARIDEDIQPGDKVIIKDGPLRAFTGIFERGMNSTDRVRILLLTVGYQAHVEIERDMVKKISGSSSSY